MDWYKARPAKEATGPQQQTEEEKTNKVTK
jgi:hypothetical protein